MAVRFFPTTENILRWEREGDDGHVTREDAQIIATMLLAGTIEQAGAEVSELTAEVQKLGWAVKDKG